jgi:iron complex outermembrane receptor protein
MVPTLFDAAFNYKIAKGTDLAVNVSNMLDEQHVVGSCTANCYNPGRENIAKASCGSRRVHLFPA